jgi:hypothetical protein
MLNFMSNPHHARHQASTSGESDQIDPWKLRGNSASARDLLTGSGGAAAPFTQSGYPGLSFRHGDRVSDDARLIVRQEPTTLTEMDAGETRGGESPRVLR